MLQTVLSWISLALMFDAFRVYIENLQLMFCTDLWLFALGVESIAQVLDVYSEMNISKILKPRPNNAAK